MSKTLVCHCEDVTESEIRKAVRKGFNDLESIKRYLAVGTGVCQAKSCLCAIAEILAEETGRSPDGLVPFVSRPPIMMTPLALFAAPDEEEAP